MSDPTIGDDTDSSSGSASGRAAGRPSRLDGPAFDAQALDRLLVHGERVGERVRYPSYREIAKRFDVAVSTVGRYSTEHNCLERRRMAQLDTEEPPEIEAEPAQVQAAEKLDAALAARSQDEGITLDRLVRIAESWFLQLEEAIAEGRLRPDLADLERFIRVIREAKAEPDERAGIPEGMPTLDEIQDLYEENLRREQEDTPAMCGRLPIGTIPISWVRANEEQLRSMLASLEGPREGARAPEDTPSGC